MNTIRRLLPLLAALAVILPDGIALRADEPDPPAAIPDAATPPAPAPASAIEPGTDTPPSPPAPKKTRRKRHSDWLITQGSDAILAENERVEAVVTILGNALVRGTVDEAVVTILGDSVIDGRVDEAVVTIMGNLRVNGHVDGDVVAVHGGIELGPDARVDGQLVAIGGPIIRDPAARVDGQTVQIGYYEKMQAFTGFRAWCREALLKGRLLSFDPRTAWAWLAAAACLGFYLLLALFFPRAITRCAEALEQRPGMTLVSTLLTLILTPLLLVLLSFTGIGTLLVLLAVFVGGFFGKAAFLAWLGRALLRPLGIRQTAICVLLGGMVLALLYAAPLVGMLAWNVTGALGLGMLVHATILAVKRERAIPPPPAAIPSPPPAAPGGGVPALRAVLAQPTPAADSAPAAPPASALAAVPAAVPAAATPASETHETRSAARTASPSDAATASLAPDAPSAPGAPVPPPPPPALWGGTGAPPSVPLRAGFWIRLAAAAIDFVLILFIAGLVDIEEYTPALHALYCGVLWTLRGTTIGGVVCGLKIVRLDGRRVDWSVALVRVLGGFLSLIIVGLGYVWVAIDHERQSWHDKIAGTTIIHAPKGQSLV
jgi:uncharacterized RDD family membrane protein YckC